MGAERFNAENEEEGRERPNELTVQYFFCVECFCPHFSACTVFEFVPIREIRVKVSVLPANPFRAWAGWIAGLDGIHFYQVRLDAFGWSR